MHRSIETFTPTWQSILHLAWPTLLVMLIQSGLNILEMFYVSHLGSRSVAAVAFVTPILLLMTTMSAGGLGGGVSSAIAMAVGKNETNNANQILGHALLLGLLIGGALMTVLLVFAPEMLSQLGAEGIDLSYSLKYADTVFWSILPLWGFNLLSAGLRGAGLPNIPAQVMIFSALWLFVSSPILIFGWGIIPAQGLKGAGIALSGYYYIALFALSLKLLKMPVANVRLSNFSFQLKWLKAIGSVGWLSLLGTIQGNLTLLLVTAAMGHMGTKTLAGYGIVSRLETLMIPIVYAVGNALITIIGMSRGAGNDAYLSPFILKLTLSVFILFELIGCFFAVFPQSWLILFFAEVEVWQAGAHYLKIVGPTFGFFAAGLLLYFASQGLGNVKGPIIAGLVRLGFNALCWMLAMCGSADLNTILTGIALGNIAMGSIGFRFVKLLLR